MESLPERIKRLSLKLGVKVVERALHDLDLKEPDQERTAHALLDEIEPLSGRIADACVVLCKIKHPKVDMAPMTWTVGRAKRLIGYVPVERSDGPETED